ncbi:MAG: peptidoglycan DD-metalloendopeptidase family protein [Gammaproteobacteria bacterium]|nr:peptidoglycan DD-metalloendopeptidase family protein [Gammaproteobacteria bacterium]
MKKIATILLVCMASFLGMSSWVYAVQNNPVPGGISVVPLDVTSEQPPVVHYRERRVLVSRADNGWQAVVGIPLNVKPGTHQLAVKPENSKKQIIRFKVNPKEYEAQYITIKNKNKVSPNKKSLERIGREKKRMGQAYRAWSDVSDMNLNFDLPVAAVRSSPFGLKRFFNNQPRRPHSGIDIAAPEGTPIRAPAAGKVILTGDFFFNGNSVFIDHGQGLITMYCHMARIDVQENQVIERGAVMGTIGQTGRATGPHLHWSVSLNKTRVNPEYFLSEASLKVLNSEQ